MARFLRGRWRAIAGGYGDGLVMEGTGGALVRRSGDNRGIAVEDLGRDANAAGRAASDSGAQRGYQMALKISRRKRLCSRMPQSDILLDRDQGRLALAARRCQCFMIRRSIYELQGPAGRARFRRGIARAH